MMPTQTLPVSNVSNEYLSAFLSSAQEEVSSVKLAEVKTLIAQHGPRIAAFFPMRALSFMIASSTLEDLKRSFEGLADHTEALSKTGFSVKQIVGILGRSGPHIAERADTFIKFTQPKIDINNEHLPLPSDLEYVLNAGLSHDRIFNLLFGSKEHLSENIKTLKEFVTPFIRRMGVQGQIELCSPHQLLAESGLLVNVLPNLLRSKGARNLGLVVNRLLSMIYASQNTPFTEMFKSEPIHFLDEFHASAVSNANETSTAIGMVMEDANDIVEMFGSSKVSPNNSEESFLLRDVAEATMEDANDILELLGTDDTDKKKSAHPKDLFLLGDADDLLLGDRDYITDMFRADLDVSK